LDVFVRGEDGAIHRTTCGAIGGTIPIDSCGTAAGSAVRWEPVLATNPPSAFAGRPAGAALGSGEGGLGAYVKPPGTLVWTHGGDAGWAAWADVPLTVDRPFVSGTTDYDDDAAAAVAAQGTTFTIFGRSFQLVSVTGHQTNASQPGELAFEPPQ